MSKLGRAAADCVVPLLGPSPPLWTPPAASRPMLTSSPTPPICCSVSATAAQSASARVVGLRPPGACCKCCGAAKLHSRPLAPAGRAAGMGLLFPWGAFLTAADYFEVRGRGCSCGSSSSKMLAACAVAGHCSTCCTLPCVTAQPAGHANLEESAECVQAQYPGQHADRLFTICCECWVAV